MTTERQDIAHKNPTFSLPWAFAWGASACFIVFLGYRAYVLFASPPHHTILTLALGFGSLGIIACTGSSLCWCISHLQRRTQLAIFWTRTARKLLFTGAILLAISALCVLFLKITLSKGEWG